MKSMEYYYSWIDEALGERTLSTNEIYDLLTAKYTRAPTKNQLVNILGKNPKRYFKIKTIRIKNNVVSFWKLNENRDDDNDNMQL